MIGPFDDGQQVLFLEIGQTFLEPDGSISKDIMPDLLHLSTTGYERWAQSLEPKLKELEL